MSTLKTTNIQHPSAAAPAIVLDAAGDATYAGTHDFTAATVTGAGGLRLITPTSIANSGGSSSVTGGAITFTGVTTISVNGCFTSTYDNYVVQIIATGGAANLAQNIRLRVAGSDNSTASSYVAQNLFVNGTSVTSSRATDDKFLIGEITTTMSALA